MGFDVQRRGDTESDHVLERSLPTRRSSSCPSEGGRAVLSVENLIGLILAVSVVIFLVAALLFPERF
jgi:K+-transporting ATPase KdpF subunit